MEIEVGKAYVFKPFDFDRPRKALVRAVDIRWSASSFSVAQEFRYDGVLVSISGKDRLVSPTTLVAPWVPRRKK